jgi:hypothetical protein
MFLRLDFRRFYQSRRFVFSNEATDALSKAINERDHGREESSQLPAAACTVSALPLDRGSINRSVGRT